MSTDNKGQKENRVLSILLAVSNSLAGLVLLMFSAWFIAACAVASAGFNYLLPAVAIRALALTKIGSGYGYMWFGHKVVLKAISRIRQGIFTRLMTGIPDNKTQQLESVAKHSEAQAGTWINVVCQSAGIVATLLLCQIFILWQLPAAGFVFMAMLLVFIAINAALIFWGLRISQKALVSRNAFVFALESELTTASLWHLRPGLLLPDASKHWQNIAQLNCLIKNGVVAFHGVNLLLLIGLINSGLLNGQGPVLLVPILLMLTAKDWLATGFGVSSAWITHQQAQHHIGSLTSRPVLKADSTPSGLEGVNSRDDFSDTGFSVNQFAAKQRSMPAVSADFLFAGIYLVSGSSGCGKSSLLHALSGLLPARGTLSVGREESGVLPDAVLMEQNVGCLSDTLKANLTLANDSASEQKLNKVLSDLCLQDIPLNAWLGDKGRRLSGGELKRLGIARAVLSQKNIWLLDEPFEGLDEGNINLVVDILNFNAKNHIIVIASHIVPKHLNYLKRVDMDVKKDIGEFSSVNSGERAA